MSNHSSSSIARLRRTCWKVPRARREHTRLPHTLYSQPIVPSQRFRIPEQIWSSSSSSSSRARISTWRENRELARASESHSLPLVVASRLSLSLSLSCMPVYKPSSANLFHFPLSLPRSCPPLPPASLVCHTRSSTLVFSYFSRFVVLLSHARLCPDEFMAGTLGGILNAARTRSYRLERGVSSRPSGRHGWLLGSMRNLTMQHFATNNTFFKVLLSYRFSID